MVSGVVVEQGILICLDEERRELIRHKADLVDGSSTIELVPHQRTSHSNRTIGFDRLGAPLSVNSYLYSIRKARG